MGCQASSLLGKKNTPVNPIETVIYTVAKPTQGVFPTDQIAQTIQKSLVQIECVIPDWPQSMRDKLEEEKALGNVTERGYNLRLAETYRNQERSGDTPIMQIEGFDADGFRLWFMVSELFVSAGFRLENDISSEKAHYAIPRIKSLISEIYPQVEFKDLTP